MAALWLLASINAERRKEAKHQEDNCSGSWQLQREAQLHSMSPEVSGEVRAAGASAF